MRRWLTRIAPAVFLLFFAPITAEYLIGYDDTIGHPDELIWGLLIFGPLYGAPALLIRELTRRAGRGWPTILVLAVAFGIVEAGLIDQSLFNDDYRDISYWDEIREPTYIPWLGTSAAMILGFIGGHVIGSFGTPIALAESLVPSRRHKPWLGWFGLSVVVLLYAGAAALVLNDTYDTETERLSAAEWIGTSFVVVALIMIAFLMPRKHVANDRPAPSPYLVILLSSVLLGVRPMLDSITTATEAVNGWPGTIVGAASLAVLAVLVLRWSRRVGWGGRHVLGVGIGVMLAIGVAAFFIDPLGEVSDSAKYATNVVLLAIVLGLAAICWRRQRAA